MLQYFRNLVACRRQDNDRGASAVEYGLLVAGIAAVIVAVVFLLGGKIQNAFNDTCTAISSTNHQAGGTCSDS
jgi:pilus assembly protein Flp/PilA